MTAHSDMVMLTSVSVITVIWYYYYSELQLTWNKGNKEERENHLLIRTNHYPTSTP